MRRQLHNVIMLTQYQYPHVGGISRVIENYCLYLGSHLIKIVSFHNIIPQFANRVLISGPSLVMNRLFRGLGTVWSYFCNVLIFNIILRILSRANKTIYMAHDIPSFNAIPRKNQKILVVHDYYTPSLIVSGSIKPKSIFEKLFKVIEKITYEKADVIITVDNRIRKYVIRFGIPENKVFTIFNAPNTHIFKPLHDRKAKYRQEFGLPLDAFIILAPRRLVKKTGVEYAVRAMEKVPERSKKYLLVIAGAGPEEENLRKLAKELNLKNKVLFLGKIEPKDMWKLYNACDIVVIPSVSVGNIQEATSLSALEAMSCGKPVIASNIGGLKEIIRHHENGFLVPEKDPSELARCIMDLATNEELLLQTGQNARHFVIRHEIIIKSQLLHLIKNVAR